MMELGRMVFARSEEHTSELQSPCNLVGRLLLEKKKPSPSSSAPSAFCPCLGPSHRTFEGTPPRSLLPRDSAPLPLPLSIARVPKPFQSSNPLGQGAPGSTSSPV